MAHQQLAVPFITTRLLKSDGSPEWRDAKFRMMVDANLTFGQWFHQITEGDFCADDVQGIVVSQGDWVTNTIAVELHLMLGLLSGPLHSDHITFTLIPEVIIVEDSAPAPGAAAASSSTRNAFEVMLAGQQRKANPRASPTRNPGTKRDDVSFRPFLPLSPMPHFLSIATAQ